MREGKHPGGRPTKYKPEYCLAVEAMARLGMTDEEMAGKIGVSTVTFHAWKKEYPEFLNALKAGKDDTDDKVEASLYQRAIGFEYTAQKPMVIDLPKGEGSTIEIAEYTARVLPDVAASFIWLKNRRPEKWRDKHEVALDTAVEIKVSFDPRGL